VVRVLERARVTLVGVYHRTKGIGFVRPMDRKVSRDLLIPKGEEGGAKGGEVVFVRITHFGDRRVPASGVIDRVLGAVDAPGVDVLAIMFGYGLVPEFPEEVERDARRSEELLARPGVRTDCRDLHVLTIDPIDAKDHDDALSVRPLGKGLWEVGVHIADVSHFVEEGSPLDREAYRRGTSVYLVDQVIPMLPHTLSSGVCSLVEGEDRLALSLFLVLDAEGRLKSHRLERTLIRCVHGLHYDQVQEVLEGRATVDPSTDTDLRLLDRLAKALRELRRGRGSLDFDLPEARVVLDEEGLPIDILRTTQLDSHRLIEEFMILANEVVAGEGEERELPIPYRVHEAPKEEKGEELRDFLASIGYNLPRRKLVPRDLQAVLDRAEGRPEAALVSSVLLRSMARAHYSPENEGHFGLASEAYSHFTSPIRRYPDLVLHRVLARALLDKKPLPERWGGGHLQEMTVHASERERIAQQAERDSIEMKKIEFMARHLGDDFEGTISNVTAFGFFVLLDRYFVEGLVHMRSLGGDYFTYLEGSHAIAGKRSKVRFQLGDRVRVRVVRASKEEREIDFQLER
jgi:ribonuclease R